MGAFLAGMLGAAGEDADKKEKRDYEEAKSERDRKRMIVQYAAETAIQKGQDAALPEIFGELDDLMSPSNAPKGMKDPFRQMGGKLAQMFKQRRQAQQQKQQQAQADQTYSQVNGVPPPGQQQAPQAGGPPAFPAATPPFLPQGQPTRPIPQPRSRIQQMTDAMGRARAQQETSEDERALSLGGRQLHQRAEIEREEGSKDFATWYARGKEAGLTNPRDLAEFAATKGQKMPSGGTSGRLKQYVKRPGSDETELAFVDKNNPEGFVDVDGNPIPGAKIASSPAQERLYSAVQGYYMYWRGKGLNEADAKAKAGEDFRDNQGKHLGRLEQQMAIDAGLSGIGPGQGFTNRPPAAAPGQQPAPPGNVPRGTPPMPAPRVVAPANGMVAPRPVAPAQQPAQAAAHPAPRGATPALPAPRLPQSQDADDVNYLVGVLSGAQKGGGHQNVRAIRGQQVLAKLGVTPEELTARVEQRKAAAKSIERLTLMSSSIEALENAISRHGDILNNLRGQLPDTDITKLNQWLMSGAREFNVTGISEPAVRYGIALQAVRNEYARVLAGGAASIATTPVDAMKEAAALMQPGFQSGNIRGMVDQVKTEATQKTGGYRDELKSLMDSMRKPLVPELYGQKYQEAPQTPMPNGSRPTGGPAPKTAEEYLKSIGR